MGKGLIDKVMDLIFDEAWVGSKIVLRVAKKGPNAGISFGGCSAFPKCRYTQNVECE